MSGLRGMVKAVKQVRESIEWEVEVKEAVSEGSVNTEQPGAVTYCTSIAPRICLDESMMTWRGVGQVSGVTNRDSGTSEARDHGKVT